MRTSGIYFVLNENTLENFKNHPVAYLFRKKPQQVVAKANRMLGFLKRNCTGIAGSTALFVFTVH